MEKMTLQWIPSPDDFVEELEVVGIIAGTQMVLAPSLPSSTIEFTYDKYPTGADCEVWVIAHGDNGKDTPSQHLTFVAQNEQVPRPVTGLAIRWDAHVV